jgi:hypothetical protein
MGGTIKMADYITVDEHTSMIIAGILKYSFEGINWEFYRLTLSEQVLIGNQINFDIIKKVCYEQLNRYKE